MQGGTVGAVDSKIQHNIITSSACQSYSLLPLALALTASALGPQPRTAYLLFEASRFARERFILARAAISPAPSRISLCSAAAATGQIIRREKLRWQRLGCRVAPTALGAGSLGRRSHAPAGCMPGRAGHSPHPPPHDTQNLRVPERVLPPNLGPRSRSIEGPGRTFAAQTLARKTVKTFNNERVCDSPCSSV